VHWRFLRRDEARAHVHAVRAQRHRGDERTAVRHAARRHERNFQFLRRTRQQNEIRHIVLARVTTTFEAVHTHRIATDRLRLQ